MKQRDNKVDIYQLPGSRVWHRLGPVNFDAWLSESSLCGLRMIGGTFKSGSPTCKRCERASQRAKP